MDEIILSWPNVSLTYMEHRNGMSCFAEFREIERSQYGYRLTVGQELHAIRYHGTNYDIFVSPVVVEIRQEGLVVAHLLQKEGAKPILCPWQKERLNGGVYKLRDLYIERASTCTRRTAWRTCWLGMCGKKNCGRPAGERSQGHRITGYSGSTGLADHGRPDQPGKPAQLRKTGAAGAGPLREATHGRSRVLL